MSGIKCHPMLAHTQSTLQVHNGGFQFSKEVLNATISVNEETSVQIH